MLLGDAHGQMRIHQLLPNLLCETPYCIEGGHAGMGEHTGSFAVAF